jgi:hypothetical protein
MVVDTAGISIVAPDLAFTSSAFAGADRRATEARRATFWVNFAIIVFVIIITGRI